MLRAGARWDGTPAEETPRARSPDAAGIADGEPVSTRSRGPEGRNTREAPAASLSLRRGLLAPWGLAPWGWPATPRAIPAPAAPAALSRASPDPAPVTYGAATVRPVDLRSLPPGNRRFFLAIVVRRFYQPRRLPFARSSVDGDDKRVSLENMADSSAYSAYTAERRASALARRSN